MRFGTKSKSRIKVFSFFFIITSFTCNYVYQVIPPYGRFLAALEGSAYYQSSNILKDKGNSEKNGKDNNDKRDRKMVIKIETGYQGKDRYPL